MPRGTWDVRRFFYGSTPEEKLRILERYDACYVLVRAGSPLNETLRSRFGFAVAYSSPGRYSLFAVDRQKPDGQDQAEGAPRSSLNEDLSRMSLGFN